MSAPRSKPLIDRAHDQDGDNRQSRIRRRWYGGDEVAIERFGALKRPRGRNREAELQY